MDTCGVPGPGAPEVLKAMCGLWLVECLPMHLKQVASQATLIKGTKVKAPR